MLKGIDVSNNNGRVNISGKDFVIAKATEGTSFRDSLFTYFWGAAKSRNMLRGAYHFMDTADPATQAEHFVDTVKAAGLTAVDILVLDAEEPALTNADITTCIRKIEALSGKNVFIYTNYSMIRLGRFNGLYSHPLWIANPGGTPGSPPFPKPWAVWAIQQYSWNVVDQDIFNGNKAAWEKLANVREPAVLPAPKVLASSERPVMSLTWKAVPGAKEYQVEIKDKKGLVVHDAMVPASAHNVVLNNGTHYTWRVKSSPNGTWSDPVELLTR